MNNEKGGLRIEKPAISLNFRFLLHIPPDAGFNRKPIQKTSILLQSYVTCLIRSTWPLESAVAQTECKQAKTNSFEKQSTDTILLFPAEEKECPFFQRIQAIRQADKGSQ